jgi:prepilin-type processing-associated H-X9-DG protein
MTYTPTAATPAKSRLFFAVRPRHQREIISPHESALGTAFISATSQLHGLFADGHAARAGRPDVGGPLPICSPSDGILLGSARYRAGLTAGSARPVIARSIGTP